MSIASFKSFKSPTAKVPWNPWLGILFAIIVFFVAEYLSDFIVSIYPILHHWSIMRTNNWLQNSIPAQFVYTFLAEAFVVGSIYFFVRHYKLKLNAIGLKKPRWIDPVYGFAAAPVYFILYLISVGVITRIIPSLNVNEKQQIGFNSVHGPEEMVMTFISLVILPPLAEEIMVRGFIYSSFRKSLKIVPAAIFTSLLFASAHLPEGGAAGPLYIAAIDTFVLSMVLIYLREKTGSLWPGITLHALKNCIAFVALFVGTTR